MGVLRLRQPYQHIMLNSSSADFSGLSVTVAVVGVKRIFVVVFLRWVQALLFFYWLGFGDG